MEHEYKPCHLGTSSDSTTCGLLNYTPTLAYVGSLVSLVRAILK